MNGGTDDPNHCATGRFLVFLLAMSPFHEIFRLPLYGVFTPKTEFSSEKRHLCLPSGRDRSLPSGRDFGAGDTDLGRPSSNGVPPRGEFFVASH